MFFKALPFEGPKSVKSKAKAIQPIKSLADYRHQKEVELIDHLIKNLTHLQGKLKNKSCPPDRLREIEQQLIKMLPIVEAQRIARVICSGKNPYKMEKKGKKYLLKR